MSVHRRGAVLFIAVLCTLAAWYCRRGPAGPPSGRSVTELEGQTLPEVQRLIRELMKREAPARRVWSPVMVKSEWQKAGAEMVRSGASRAEVAGVMHTAVGVLGTRKNTYGIPLYRVRGTLSERPVWVIGCGWGNADILPDAPRPQELPGHYWWMVIDARSPYALLGSASCM